MNTRPGIVLPFVAVSLLAQPPPSANVEADLRRMTQELMDAIAPGHTDVWRRYLHEKMLQLDENGAVRDKDALLNLRTRFRSLDTWVRTSEGWRLIAQHTAAVLKDPPAIRLTKDELCAYAGVYQLTPDITTTIACTDAGLTSK